MKSFIKMWVELRCSVMLTVVLSCTTVLARAENQSIKQLYEAAGKSYHEKQYQQAAQSYESILSQGVHDAAVYYNLGNCYYKMDSMGQCILNYERALKRSPSDDDVIHNLQLANAKIVDRIEPVPQLGIITWWHHFLDSSSSSSWAKFALVALWLAFVAAAAGLFFRRRRLFFSVATLFMAVSILLAVFAFVRKQEEMHSDEAILMAASVNIKSAPDAGSDNLFLLHEGTKVSILDRVGTWNKIRLADGKEGWLEAGQFETI